MKKKYYSLAVAAFVGLGATAVGSPGLVDLQNFGNEHATVVNRAGARAASFEDLTAEVKSLIVELEKQSMLRVADELAAAYDAAKAMSAENPDEAMAMLEEQYYRAMDAYKMCMIIRHDLIPKAEDLMNKEPNDDLAKALDEALMATNVDDIPADYYIYVFKNLQQQIDNTEKLYAKNYHFDLYNSYSTNNMVYYLDKEKKVARFAGYQGEGISELVVPDVFVWDGEEYPVVSISGGFNYGVVGKITKIVLPESIKEICEDAFGGFNNLFKVKMLSSEPPVCEKYLGSGNFVFVVPDGSEAAYLSADVWKNYIIVPENPEEITVNIGDAGDLGLLLFDQVNNLDRVHKLKVSGPMNNDDWKVLGELKALVSLDLSEAKSSRVPNDVFSNKRSLTNVILPETLKEIGDGAFYGTSLESVVIPNSVTALGYKSFAECRLLKSVTLSENLKIIPDHCFHLCNIEKLELPSSLVELQEYAFSENNNLKEVVFGDNLNKIGSRAFDICDGLKTLNIPSSVKTIGDNAFSACRALESLTLNEGLESIGWTAFWECNLKEVVLPSTVTKCEYSFNNCYNIRRFESKAIVPPTSNYGCPCDIPKLSEIVLVVPKWSRAQYKLAHGWSEFNMDLMEVSTDYPQNIKINKNFEFLLDDELDADYMPNLTLEVTNEGYTNGYGEGDYHRGNLTINGRSKLNVNNFSMYLSPYAKWSFDQNRFYWDNYGHGAGMPEWLNTTCLYVKGAMRAENVNVQLITRNLNWQFVCFPFDVPMANIVPEDASTQWVVREYSGYNRANNKLDETWLNLTKDDVLKAGKGYIMMSASQGDWAKFNVSPDKESLTRQDLFVSTDRTVALNEYLSEFAQNRSWNLVGNPYPTYYDTRYMDFKSPITVWSNYENNYKAYSPQDDAYILAPCEAFFVQRPLDQETITFAKDGRQIHWYDRNSVANAQVRTDAADVQKREVYNFTLGNGERIDRTRVVINESATLGYDMTCDASKFMSSDMDVPQLFTLNGDVRYAINERPLAGAEVTLGFRVGKAGEYVLRITNSTEGEVYVEDRLTGKTVLLTDQGYKFEAEAGENLNRMVLHFGPLAPTGIDGVDADKAAADNGVTLDGKPVGEGYKGIVVKKNRKSFNH